MTDMVHSLLIPNPETPSLRPRTLEGLLLSASTMPLLKDP